MKSAEINRYVLNGGSQYGPCMEIIDYFSINGTPHLRTKAVGKDVQLIDFKPVPGMGNPKAPCPDFQASLPPNCKIIYKSE